MFRKLMFFCIVSVAVFVTSNCASTPTPSVTQTAYLDLYREPDQCPTMPNQAGGDITYESWMQGSFSGTLHITGLEPNHNYAFTINGQDGSSGNKQLKSSPSCKSTANGEGYCDILVQSDDQGTINKPITKQLNPGQYEPKFFIKDKEQGFCPVMYNDTPETFEIKK